MTEAGGNGDEAEIEWRNAIVISQPDRQHAFQNIKHQYHRCRGFPANTQHICRAGITGTIKSRVRQSEQSANQDRAGNGAAQIREKNHTKREYTHNTVPSSRGRFVLVIRG